MFYNHFLNISIKHYFYMPIILNSENQGGFFELLIWPDTILTRELSVAIFVSSHGVK